MQTTHKPSASLLQDPVISTFIYYMLGMRNGAQTRLCVCVSFFLLLNWQVLVLVYGPSPCVQYPDAVRDDISSV